MEHTFSPLYDNWNADPVRLSDALKFFFNKAQINIHQGTVKINLLQGFPLLKKGISTVNIINHLMLIYAKMNNLDNPQGLGFEVSNDLYYESFGKLNTSGSHLHQQDKSKHQTEPNLPALYFNKIEFGDPNMSMDDAVTSGLISRPLNTFEVIKTKFPQFSPDKIEYGHRMAIISYNIQHINSNYKIEHDRKIASRSSN